MFELLTFNRKWRSRIDRSAQFSVPQCANYQILSRNLHPIRAPCPFVLYSGKSRRTYADAYNAQTQPIIVWIPNWSCTRSCQSIAMSIVDNNTKRVVYWPVAVGQTIFADAISVSSSSLFTKHSTRRLSIRIQVNFVCRVRSENNRHVCCVGVNNRPYELPFLCTF